MSAADFDFATGPSLIAIQRAIDEAARLLVEGRAHLGALIPKGSRDFATAVDLEAERTVRLALRELVPHVGFLGEEWGASSLVDETFWVLDPIDGTVNYARGSPLCAISLALVDQGRARLAIVDLPFLGERYVAAEGRGAFLNGSPITVAHRGLADAVVGFTDFCVGRDAPAENVLHLRLMSDLARTALRVRVHGSEALDLAWVACGRLDAAIMLSNLPWDVTGGVLLVREAGGAVVDLDGSEHTLASQATIATTRTVQRPLLNLVSSATCVA